MGGGGKTEIDALARASGHRPPHGGVYFGLGNERAKPLVFPLMPKNSAGQAFKQQRSGSQKRCPRTARRRLVMWRQAECETRLLRKAQRSRRSERASGAQPARREARAPAGQHKNAAPSGARSAGQSATSLFPLISTAPDRHPNGPGLEAQSAPADRAGCPKGSTPCIKSPTLWS
jgi:hypothetical protein